MDDYNKMLHREDNSYQDLLQVENICHDCRKGNYSKQKLEKAIALLRKVIKQEEN